MKKSLSALLPIAILAMTSSVAIAATAAAPAASAQSVQPAATETLPTGIVVKHTKAGTGASPVAADTVQVHYRGRLADGAEFDSSYKRGRPTSFPLDRVIPCWTQGLQKMKVGGAATLTCPPATAYGSRAAGGVIPPNATLTFEVELLAIEKKR
jgi:FKBP-type peptidyl-prolyl cis-trans isomerase FkpA